MFPNKCWGASGEAAAGAAPAFPVPVSRALPLPVGALSQMWKGQVLLLQKAEGVFLAETEFNLVGDHVRCETLNMKNTFLFMFFTSLFNLYTTG